MRYESYRDNTYLEHYGIKGQQWGVRRFQNEDGSLTTEGKERYYKDDSKSGNQRNNITGEKTGFGRAILEAVFPKLKERRINKAKKEIEDAKLSDRFDDKEIDHYSRMTNSKFRKQVIQDMQKNPNEKYFDAYRSRLRKNIAISAAMMVAAPIVTSVIMRNSDKIRDFFNSFKKKPVSDSTLDLTKVETYKSDISGARVTTFDPRRPSRTIGAPAIDFDQIKKR